MISLRKSFTGKLPDSFFSRIKNVQSKIKGKPERYDFNNGKIKISDRTIQWTTHRHRCHLYSGGFSHRGSSIGKSYLLENINFSDGDVILDCGANMGDLQLYFWNQDVKVKYIGVEPNPLDFECLSENMLLEGAKCLQLALWNKAGTLDFWVDSKSASSSLIEPSNFTEKVSIEAVRLDEIQTPGRIKLLKVEGEGAEPEILSGCAGILHKVEYISADVGPERGINQTSTRKEVIKYLAQNNFEIVEENRYHRKTILFKNKG